MGLASALCVEKKKKKKMNVQHCLNWTCKYIYLYSYLLYGTIFLSFYDRDEGIQHIPIESDPEVSRLLISSFY